VDLESVCAV
jgi:hypothetical protein